MSYSVLFLVGTLNSQSSAVEHVTIGTVIKCPSRTADRYGKETIR